jgi:hypothetical protein
MIKCTTLARVRVHVVCVCACGLLGYRASARVQRMLTRTLAHAGALFLAQDISISVSLDTPTNDDSGLC